jgi:hypothetical protein
MSNSCIDANLGTNRYWELKTRLKFHVSIRKPNCFSANPTIDLQAKLAHTFIYIITEILSFVLNRHLIFAAKQIAISLRIEFIRNYFKTGNNYEHVTWSRLLKCLQTEVDVFYPIDKLNFSLI